MGDNFGNGCWLLEDKGGWVAGNDPELVDSTDFTAEGNDYFTTTYGRIEKGGNFVADYEDIPGWQATDISIEEGHDTIKVKGTYQGATFTATQDKEDALDAFFRAHSSLSDSSFYFVKRWSANHFKKWPDEDRTQREYCKVRFAAKPKTFIANRVLNYSYTLRSVWGS